MNEERENSLNFSLNISFTPHSACVFQKSGVEVFCRTGFKNMSSFTNPFIYMTAAIFQATVQVVVIMSSDPFI